MEAEHVTEASEEGGGGFEDHFDLEASAFVVEFGDFFEDIGAEFDEAAEFAVDDDLIAVEDEFIEVPGGAELEAVVEVGGLGGEDGGGAGREGGEAAVIDIALVAEAELREPSGALSARDHAADPVLSDKSVLEGELMEFLDVGFALELLEEAFGLIVDGLGRDRAQVGKEGEEEEAEKKKGSDHGKPRGLGPKRQVEKFDARGRFVSRAVQGARHPQRGGLPDKRAGE